MFETSPMCTWITLTIAYCFLLLFPFLPCQPILCFSHLSIALLFLLFLLTACTPSEAMLFWAYVLIFGNQCTPACRLWLELDSENWLSQFMFMSQFHAKLFQYWGEMIDLSGNDHLNKYCLYERMQEEFMLLKKIIQISVLPEHGKRAGKQLDQIHVAKNSCSMWEQSLHHLSLYNPE